MLIILPSLHLDGVSMASKASQRFTTIYKTKGDLWCSILYILIEPIRRWNHAPFLLTSSTLSCDSADRSPSEVSRSSVVFMITGVWLDAVGPALWVSPQETVPTAVSALYISSLGSGMWRAAGWDGSLTTGFVETFVLEGFAVDMAGLLRALPFEASHSASFAL